ncbi:tetratricopeptide repeat protein [Kitasatospora sp. NPDC101155]|uniref:tetratricopeptide repeat protein n=1 Tax=Kitasatospora sp. NPDC101155 TaxID=3364097 RepID=UPI00380D3439
MDDDPEWRVPAGAVRWGRLVTDRPGTGCETWGVPNVAQRPQAAALAPADTAPQHKAAVEAAQLRGAVNPGSGFVGNRYVLDLLQHPPQWSLPGTSPWGGLSGAAVFCDRLLAGVVASERAHSAHAQLNVVPAYVLHHDPAFRAALAEHIGPAGCLEAVEFQDLADPAVTAPRGPIRSPAALLQAGRQTVPFHGRKDLLQRLMTWCARGGFGAWLLHGPGGQGKTRLAHHLAGLLAADRWAVLWPHADASPDRLREIRLATCHLLVVLDYAETRTRQLAALIEAAADHPGTTQFKILLLARTDGDWWDRAKTVSSLAEEYLDAAPAQALPPLEEDLADRPGAYRDAARALATALHLVEGCAGHDWPALAGALRMPQLDHEGYGNALTLHMTALADLLDTTAPTPPGDPAGQAGLAEYADGGGVRQVAERVEDRLLGHERRYWDQAAAIRGLAPGLSSNTLEVALATAHLVGAADPEQADRTWCRLAVLADQTRDRRDAVTAWIGALYPPTVPGRPWSGLQPDRLAERHTGRVLDAGPTLADDLLHGADDPQASQLLTVYSRAAAHSVFHGRLDTHLTGLCIRHQHQLAAQIITIATQTDHPAPLTAALDTITADPTTPLDDLTALQQRFPQSSWRLGHSAARLAQALTDRYRVLAEANPDAYLPDLARALNNLSIRLAEAGRREEGLAPIREAVEIRRVLAAANPDAYLPDFAGSLNNLSIRLAEVGRREEGLAPIREAVDILRTLAEVDPDALPGLARALSSLSGRLGEVGRREEALAAIQEAVDILRMLAEVDPDALPGLARALSSLSGRLGEVGRREEALAPIQEAADIHRTLATATPDAHLPDLARSLNNLSGRLGEVGRREEGLAAIQEAVDIRRTLAEANPDAYLPDLAATLNSFSIDLGQVGRTQEGLAAIQEAVDIRRTLAEANPDAHLPDLARSLHNLSNRLGELGRREEGLAAIQEAVDIRRTLAEANPDAYLPYLAMSLHNLSSHLGEAGRREEGLTAIQETVRHYRTLAAIYPALFEEELRRSLRVAAWLEALP